MVTIIIYVTAYRIVVNVLSNYRISIETNKIAIVEPLIKRNRRCSYRPVLQVSLCSERCARLSVCVLEELAGTNKKVGLSTALFCG